MGIRSLYLEPVDLVVIFNIALITVLAGRTLFDYKPRIVENLGQKYLELYCVEKQLHSCWLG